MEILNYLLQQENAAKIEMQIAWKLVYGHIPGILMNL